MLAREYPPFVNRAQHPELCPWRGQPSGCPCADDIESRWVLSSEDGSQPVANPGKWTVLPPATRVDDAWKRVGEETQAGRLGFAAECSLRSRERPAILVYCSGASCELVKQRLLELARGLWGDARLLWKSDAPPGSSSLATWRQAVPILRGVDRAHLLPPEHRDGSPAGSAAALQGDALLKLAVLRALDADGLELYAARQSDPVELTTHSAAAVSNELLSQQAEEILLGGGLATADLELSEHERGTVVEAAVYHVHRLLEQQPERGLVAARGGGDGGGASLPRARAALEDLALHLIAASRGRVNWLGLFLENGGRKERITRCDIGGKQHFVAEVELRGLTLRGAPSSSRDKAATSAAQLLLTRLGLPQVPPAFVPDFATLVARAGVLRAQCDGVFTGAQQQHLVDFCRELQQRGGELLPHEEEASDSLRPSFCVTARLAGVTRKGSPMPTADSAARAAAAAALCAAGLITPQHATLALADWVRTPGDPAAAGRKAVGAAVTWPRQLAFGLKRVEDTAGFLNSSNFKGLLVALGGVVHKAEQRPGGAAHEPKFTARATLGRHCGRATGEHSRAAAAEAAAAEAVLRLVFGPGPGPV